MTDSSQRPGPAGRHLIVGAGVIGRATAQALRAGGHDVRLTSRTPSRQGSADAAHPSLDALDAAAFRDATRGVSHLYLTLGLPYRAAVWERDWPRIMQNAIDAALAHGARLVWFDNVYAYGPLPLQVPMREDHPIDPPSRKGKVRARLLDMLRQAGDTHGLHWLVGRSADFYGPDVRLSVIYSAAIERQLQGRAAWWLGDPDAPHSFTYTLDAGRALALLALAPDTGQQSWHLPTASPAPTPRQLLMDSARLLGAPTTVHRMPPVLTTLLSPVVPMLGEVGEMLYQNQQAYVFDSSKFMARFPDFRITPYAQGMAGMAESFRASAKA